MADVADLSQVHDFLKVIEGTARSQGSQAMYVESLHWALKWVERNQETPSHANQLLRLLKKRLHTNYERGAAHRRRVPAALSDNRVGREQVVVPWPALTQAVHALAVRALAEHKDTVTSLIWVPVSLRKIRARLLHDALLAMANTRSAPNRAKELRTCGFSSSDELPPGLKHPVEPNSLFKDQKGELWFVFTDHKTVRSHGAIYRNLTTEAPEIVPVAEAYLDQRYRLVTQGRDEGMVFLNTLGRPFSSACLSQYLQRLFDRALKAVGVTSATPVATNIIRRSCVTAQHVGATLSQQISLAHAMGHSHEVAVAKYNRPTYAQRTALATEMANQWWDEAGSANRTECTAVQQIEAVLGRVPGSNMSPTPG